MTTFRKIEASRSNEEQFSALALELKTPRLNSIHRHLWLAGRPTAARPLHRQKLLGRTILITEDPNEHLVWFEDQIFVKPLPDFLLDWQSWNKYLCLDRELHKAACSLLLSYAWLVRHKSDLDIAKETGLLSKEVGWPDWVEFIDAFLNNINCETLSDVDQRYKYGELRLSRLNSIYRLVPPKCSLRNFIGGYQNRSKWYQAFFDRQFQVDASCVCYTLCGLVGTAGQTCDNNTAGQQTVSECFIRLYNNIAGCCGSKCGCGLPGLACSIFLLSAGDVAE